MNTPATTPQNPRSEFLMLAADAWLNIVCNYKHGKPCDEDCHYADTSLEKALLNHGVMKADDAVLEICASDTDPAICVTFEDSTCLLIDATTGEWSRA